MNCKVQGVFKNLRYRILTIDGEQYIMDMGSSIWKIIFPFFFWMLPNRVYRVDDPNIVIGLKSPEVNQIKTGHSSVLGAGIGLILTTLLEPLSEYLAIPGTRLINSIILLIIVVFVFALCVSVNNKLKKKLCNVVNLEELSMDKLWIRPRSIKHFSQALVTYLFFLALTLVFFWFAITDPDVITLISTAVGLLFVLFTHVLMATAGYTTVKFKCRKKQRFNDEYDRNES
ncbi:DUF443 family protein [Virgibacillus sp. FSP13]